MPPGRQKGAGARTSPVPGGGPSSPRVEARGRQGGGRALRSPSNAGSELAVLSHLVDIFLPVPFETDQGEHSGCPESQDKQSPFLWPSYLLRLLTFSASQQPNILTVGLHCGFYLPTDHPLLNLCCLSTTVSPLKPTS